MGKVKKAEHLGFCKGAENALERIANIDKAYILGDVVHNKQVMDLLAKNNKTVIEDVSGNEDRPIIITAHGIIKKEKERL